MSACECCGGELNGEWKYEQGRKCARCWSGACRCRLTPEQEAGADALVDEMADAAGMGDAEEEQHDRDCRCVACGLAAFEAAEENADARMKADSTGGN